MGSMVGINKLAPLVPNLRLSKVNENDSSDSNHLETSPQRKIKEAFTPVNDKIIRYATPL